MKSGVYVYRLECGEVFSGPYGLAEGASAECPLHGSSRIAGYGISVTKFELS